MDRDSRTDRAQCQGVLCLPKRVLQAYWAQEHSLKARKKSANPGWQPFTPGTQPIRAAVLAEELVNCSLFC